MGEAKRRERAAAEAAGIYREAAVRALRPMERQVRPGAMGLPPPGVWAPQDGWRPDLLDVADPEGGPGSLQDEAVALDERFTATFNASHRRRAATVCVFDGDRGGYAEWFMWSSFAVDWHVEIAAAWRDGRIGAPAGDMA